MKLKVDVAEVGGKLSAKRQEVSNLMFLLYRVTC